MERAIQFNTIQLATQQFRLRSLSKIEGVNIETQQQQQKAFGLYYTLHYNEDDEAFYTSELLPRHIKQKWADINCPEVFKSNKNCVCVKVWLKVVRQKPPDKDESSANDVVERGSRDAVNKDASPTEDKLLFCWGVYFSGLTRLTGRNDVELKKNALIFHIKGFEYTSPKYISSGIATRDQQTSTYKRGSQHNENLLTISSSPESYSIKSPPTMNTNYSPSVPSSSELRLLQLNCPRNEVRRCYDLDKLLRIQEAQRQRIRTLKESAEIAASIKQLCVHCITPEELNRRRYRTISSSYGGSSSKYSSNQQYHQQHSMGRKLSKLLAEDDHIEPSALLHAKKLLRDLESLRFRNGLLVTEKKTLKDRFADLKTKLSTISAERVQRKSELEIQVSNLEKEKLVLEELYIERKSLLNRRETMVQSLEKRRATLIAELQEIYPIKRNEHGIFTICDIPCPSLDPIAYTSNPALDQVSPLALRASMGYIAHLVKMISIIIDQPLRSPLTIDETWIHYYKPKFSKSSTS